MGDLGTFFESHIFFSRRQLQLQLDFNMVVISSSATGGCFASS